MRISFFLATILCVWIAPCPRLVEAIPPGFVEELVTTTRATLTNTGAVARASTGQIFLFLGSKLGKIFVLINPDNNPDVHHLLIDLPVCDNGERGIQTVVPHPDFASNGYLYVYRTEYKEGCDLDYVTGPQNRLSRFTVSIIDGLPTIDTATELSLFRGPVQNGKTHNGGGMAFGNDGYLYITIGDGGFTVDRHSRNPQTLNGSVLRFGDNGEVPTSNPFVGSNGVRCNSTGIVPVGSNNNKKCSEIYAIGLRNPFRLAMDPNTKDKVRFYIGDVGGKQWEEISECGTDYAGANYGWDFREGPCKRDSDTDCDQVAGYDDPIYWYAHRRFTSGGAVTGGAFVPNGVWPTEYDGTYMFVDLTYGEMYQMIEGGEDCRTCSPPTPKFTNRTFHTAPTVVDMFFGPYEDTQALYYLSLFDGTLRRIRYTGTDNRSPIPVIAADVTTVLQDEIIQFDASDSTDPDGDELSYRWDFDDGSAFSTEVSPSYTFSKRGQYQVELVVKDSSGLSSRAFLLIVVGEPPSVEMTAPAEGATFAVGDVFTLSGKAWYVNGNGNRIALNQLEWEVQQHHAQHFHPFLAPVQRNNFMIDPAPPPEDYVAATNSFLRVILTAYNDDGLSTTVTRDIMPRLSYLDIASEPSGMQVSVDGSLVITPVRVLSWENHGLLVAVEDQDKQIFRGWSNGNPREHVVTIPPGDGPIPKIIAHLNSAPSAEPSTIPSSGPSFSSSRSPTIMPSMHPSLTPSNLPSLSPTAHPVASQPPQHINLFPLVKPIRKDCSLATPCGRCEGHCKHDFDCGEGLICFYKDRGTEGENAVPGCSGQDTSLTDWCIPGLRSDDQPIPLVRPLKKFCSKDDPCGRCEGHCFNNDGCEGGLVCFEKDQTLPGVDSIIPGCIGQSQSRTDWCTTTAAILQDSPSVAPSTPSMLSELPSATSSRSPSNFVADLPSLSPTVLALIPLVKPSRKDCSATNPCGRCEGHCKFDVDCGEGLICFYKENGIPGEDAVPGCSGSDTSLTDWCTVGTRSKYESIPLVRPAKQFCSEDDTCGRCEGHCFNDDDCKDDLVCYKKEQGIAGIDSVPGCIGHDLSHTDWCTTVPAIEQSSFSWATSSTLKLLGILPFAGMTSLALTLIL